MFRWKSHNLIINNTPDIDFVWRVLLNHKYETKEELGADVEVVCKIGVVSDYYNLIHRHNINNYFLCRVNSFGDKNLTEDEINCFHLSTLKLSYEDAVKEYEYRSNTRLGKLVANRELPVLYRAKEMIDFGI